MKTTVKTQIKLMLFTIFEEINTKDMQLILKYKKNPGFYEIKMYSKISLNIWRER